MLASSGAETFGTSGSADGEPDTADDEAVDGDAVPPVVVVHAVVSPADTVTTTARTPSLLRNKFGSPMP
ncbi:hypothetical protein GCM10017567_03790 [Amycolatopsis bullii]|uniref:Uncharacterized protein n=1 Tax=Amycolatopsis bullii TaxID=941987 RepID=A0ABQ3JZ12_9PSEU|nr:hypothetical protein GCM10017567_03790 [Amycolatopsis bullii]